MARRFESYLFRCWLPKVADLQRLCPLGRNQWALLAGLTSGLSHQSHTLVFVGSSPTPATIVCLSGLRCSVGTLMVVFFIYIADKGDGVG